MKPAVVDDIATSLASVGGSYAYVAAIFKHQNGPTLARRVAEPDSTPRPTPSSDTPPRG
jgi:hypothetical protein